MSPNNFTPIAKPISLPKEVEPFAGKEPEIKEVVEHELEKEVAPFIKKRAETIKLPPDLKKLGLQTSSTSQFSSLPTVNLPISDDKVISGLHAPITSSLRWLATLAIYILRQAHLGLKVIHGHVVRVFKK